MDVFITKLLTTVALPPGFNIALLVLGLVLLRRSRRVAMTFLLGSILSLYLFSIPVVSRFLITQLEIYPALVLEAGLSSRAGAIVALGGGLYRDAPEYGADTLSSSNLPRLRYAAYLHRHTGLPILVTGGRVYGEGISEGQLMARYLTAEQSVEVKWRDTSALNTAENALNAYRILSEVGVDKIILVTHALHMDRALKAFEKVGFTVIAAPVEFKRALLDYPGALDWLPNTTALSNTGNALHEIVGRLWYSLRYP